MSFFRRQREQKPVREASGQFLVQELTESELRKAYAPLREGALPTANDHVALGGSERRSDPRYPCSMHVGCDPVVVKGKKPWAAEVQNVSAGGIALVLGRRFEPGTVLMVVPQRQTELPSSLLVRVAHTQPHGVGQWLVGCRLACHMGEDDWRELLDAWGSSKSGGPSSGDHP
jgi:hypothetical protein